MWKERLERILSATKDKVTKQPEWPEEWLITGEVPAHGLVMTSSGNSDVQARLESGELEKVGEVSVYIGSPQSYLVVRRTTMAVGVVAATAVAGFGVYKTIEYFLKRKRRKSYSK